MVALANLLAVDEEAVEGFASPAEAQLEHLVQLFQGEVVGNRNQPRNERADF